MKPTRRKSKFAVQEDSDPLSVVVNLFDGGDGLRRSADGRMVMHMNMTEVFTQEDFTVVKNPGKENMEIIMKEGNKINKYTPSEQQVPVRRASASASPTNWKTEKSFMYQNNKQNGK